MEARDSYTIYTILPKNNWDINTELILERVGKMSKNAGSDWRDMH